MYLARIASADLLLLTGFQPLVSKCKLHRYELVPHTPPRDLFGALDDYLKNRGERFQAVFDRFDVDGTGALDAAQLRCGRA